MILSISIAGAQNLNTRNCIRLDYKFNPSARLMDEKVGDFVNMTGERTYEWCKAKGDGFKVGLLHLTNNNGGDGEKKFVVVKQDGSQTAYPVMYVGEGTSLPETTIHINKKQLWVELKEDSELKSYYFYNVATGKFGLSTLNEYKTRTQLTPSVFTFRDSVAYNGHISHYTVAIDLCKLKGNVHKAAEQFLISKINEDSYTLKQAVQNDAIKRFAAEKENNGKGCWDYKLEAFVIIDNPVFTTLTINKKDIRGDKQNTISFSTTFDNKNAKHISWNDILTSNEIKKEYQSLLYSKIKEVDGFDYNKIYDRYNSPDSFPIPSLDPWIGEIGDPNSIFCKYEEGEICPSEYGAPQISIHCSFLPDTGTGMHKLAMEYELHSLQSEGEYEEGNEE